jgi:hypothetical protein
MIHSLKFINALADGRLDKLPGAIEFLLLCHLLPSVATLRGKF